ncbi:hypothetical protein GCM10009844_31710 [Nocardioides koreensis]|uniref:DUF4232 domain-containing protein n=1 Tax=Nocardioides koreensis TaxID=433651 RepID=A0ABP5LST7_9ACTN
MPIVVTVLALLLSGCLGAADPATEDASGSGATRCPSAYPIRLPITTDATVGVPPLYRLRACAVDARRGPVLLMNDGNAAWATVAPGHEFNLVQGDEPANWLRERVAVPPGMVLPGTAIVVQARPSEVSWRLSREWTVGWAGFEAGMHALAPRGRDTVARAMDPDAARGQALVSCALTAYHLYLTAQGDPLPVHDGFGALQLTWSAASTACAADWLRADRLLTAQGARATGWSLAVIRADSWVTKSKRALGWLAPAAPVVIGVR